MSDWFETLDGIHRRVWATLVDGVADRAAPARHVVLATQGPDGWPEARTVVLRGARPEEAVLEVHTDLHSDKIASLRKLPRAALHVWDAEQQLQVRVQADVQIASGPDVAEIWAKVPDPSRQSYGVTPAPGQPIADALAYAKVPDPATFAVLRCRVYTIDAVHLGADHRRARFVRDGDWAGQWLSP
ncbi:pyridoxamine 5'-phosphate oxidase family protein [Flavimaricola marinus]|uniref:Pyridoxamine 5'-phosphate oxidase n=1 Tax=Flavimaricola marinus TaxID=1819565 RepID=A0A238LC71_9RHOB|nr:pyridoxamine 5'-phosphate oxidase family protein [Flavimaricola marinus]SMY07005.1 pyridoxamine 5'-phosphate oxidase [Flavimaricola marinus]